MYLTKVSQKITEGKAFIETYPPRSKDELAWEHNKKFKLLDGDMHELAEVAVEV